MMTEEEAKTKWCPFGRYVLDDADVAGNRFPNGGETKCIASGCMAWREYDLHPSATEDSKPYGWCGLAGQSE